MNKCILEDCEAEVVKNSSAQGMCPIHYRRWLRTGDPRKGGRKYEGVDLKYYQIWKGIIKRCYNQNNHAYKYYGARGVTVCERWLNSYIDFMHDMGDRPTPKHSVDRIDPEGNYTPENCRWATTTEQRLNQRRMKKSNTTGN